METLDSMAWCWTCEQRQRTRSAQGEVLCERCGGPFVEECTSEQQVGQIRSFVPPGDDESAQENPPAGVSNVAELLRQIGVDTQLALPAAELHIVNGDLSLRQLRAVSFYSGRAPCMTHTSFRHLCRALTALLMSSSGELKRSKLRMYGHQRARVP